MSSTSSVQSSSQWRLTWEWGLGYQEVTHEPYETNKDLEKNGALGPCGAKGDQGVDDDCSEWTLSMSLLELTRKAIVKP